MRQLSLAIAALTTAFFANTAHAEPKWHPLDSYTAIYDVTGSQEGTATYHSRDYGRQLVQLMDVSMQMSGMSFDTKMQTINNGPDVLSVDLVNNTKTESRNTVYDKVKDQLGADGAKNAFLMMEAAGLSNTGEAGKAAGRDCAIWKNADGTNTMCVTKDAIMVQMKISAGSGFSTEYLLKSLEVGNGGPDSAFSAP